MDVGTLLLEKARRTLNFEEDSCFFKAEVEVILLIAEKVTLEKDLKKVKKS